MHTYSPIHIRSKYAVYVSHCNISRAQPNYFARVLIAYWNRNYFKNYSILKYNSTFLFFFFFTSYSCSERNTHDMRMSMTMCDCTYTHWIPLLNSRDDDDGVEMTMIMWKAVAWVQKGLREIQSFILNLNPNINKLNSSSFLLIICFLMLLVNILISHIFIPWKWISTHFLLRVNWFQFSLTESKISRELSEFLECLSGKEMQIIHKRKLKP